ncbi:MAG: hypothetical protein V1875_07090 [Candidatus Altiarchaeota archaeon]
MDLAYFLFPAQNPIQFHALVFLLGSLSVSSLSDLRRMAAQADFAEVWGAFTAFMFLTDIYLGLTAQLGIAPFVIKWALIALFVAVNSGSGIFSISTMDVTAVAALLATLNPTYIILTLPLMVLVNEFLKPLLSKYGEGGAYPFLPTVFAVNMLLLLVILAGGLEELLISSS